MVSGHVLKIISGAEMKLLCLNILITTLIIVIEGSNKKKTSNPID